MDAVLAGRPANDADETDRDEKKGERERHDTDDHSPSVAFVTVPNDNLFHDRGRIAADSRSSPPGCCQVDGLLSRLERIRHAR